MPGPTSGHWACCSTRWSPAAARLRGRAAATCSPRSWSVSPRRWRASHPDVPAELQRIVGKALRKDREQRYQVMKDLLLDLQALRDELAGPGIEQSCRRSTPGPVATPTPLAVPASTGVTPRSQSSAEYVVTGLDQTQGRCGARRMRPGVDRWRCVVGGSAIDPQTSGVVRSRARPANADTSDVRVGPPDGRDVVAGRTLHRVRVRPDRQLRHLGAAGRWRRSRPGDAISRAGHATGLVAGWQHPRVPLRARRRRPLPRAGTRWSGAATDLVRLLSFLVSGRLRRSCSWMKPGFGSSRSPARLFAVSPEEGAPREILADFLAGRCVVLDRAPSRRTDLGAGPLTASSVAGSSRSRGTERGSSTRRSRRIFPFGSIRVDDSVRAAVSVARLRHRAVRPDRIEWGLQPLESACRSEHAPVGVGRAAHDRRRPGCGRCVVA